MPAVATPKVKVNPLLKLVLEMGPLCLFFAANTWPEVFKPLVAPFLDPSYFAGETSKVFIATPIFMVATLVSLAAGWLLTRHIPIMPLVSCILVVIFGALTLWYKDRFFIQVKPTVANVFFGSVLLAGAWLGRSPLKIILAVAFEMTEEAWRILTIRWGFFFLFLAGFNEVTREFLSYETWQALKVWATMPITMIFAATQVPLMLRSELKQPEEAAASAADQGEA